MTEHVAPTDRDLELIRARTRELASALERLAQHIWAAPTDESSITGARLASEANRPGFLSNSRLAREATSATLIATFSGVDHTRAAIRELLGRRTHVAIATLTRAALEAFAKAYHLLTAADPQEYADRYIVLLSQELQHPFRNSQFRDHVGELVDNQVYKAWIIAELGRLNMKLGAGSTEQTKIQALLSHLDGAKVDPNIYSQLSAIAHSATSAIGMFVVDKERPTFGMLQGIATEYSAYLLTSLWSVGDLLAETNNVTGPPLERWKQACDRALRAALES